MKRRRSASVPTGRPTKRHRRKPIHIDPERWRRARAMWAEAWNSDRSVDEEDYKWLGYLLFSDDPKATALLQWMKTEYKEPDFSEFCRNLVDSAHAIGMELMTDCLEELLQIDPRELYAPVKEHDE